MKVKSFLSFRLIMFFLLIQFVVAYPAFSFSQETFSIPSLKKVNGIKKIGRVEEVKEPQAAPFAIFEKAIDPDRYLLGPGDQLVLSLVGSETRTFQLSVLPEGYLYIPEVGAIYADGLSISEFREKLYKKLSKYFHNIEIHCYLSVPRLFKVFVSGEVKKPGGVEASAVERVSDALERAGGLKRGASNRKILLIRDGDTLSVDLERFLSFGDTSANPFLDGGDVIVVPPLSGSVTIVGEVRRSGRFEVLPHETIADIVTLAGGFSEDAITDSLLVTRVRRDGSVYSFVVKKEKFNLEVKDLDQISVFNRLKKKRVVYVSGAVRHTGMFFLAEGEGLSEILARTGGFNTNADLSKVYVRRVDGSTISLDLRESLMPDVSCDLELHDGDVIEVPAIYPKVIVGGEVNLPGEYPYRADWTVAQYVGLAGGPTSNGSLSRVVIYSSDGTVRSARTSDKPGKGDAIIVKRSRTKIIGEFLSGVIRLGTVVISILVLTR